MSHYIVSFYCMCLGVCFSVILLILCVCVCVWCACVCVQRHIVLAAKPPVHVQVMAAYVRRNGKLCMDMKWENKSDRALTKFAMLVNKVNYLGVCAAAPLQVCMSGSTHHTHCLSYSHTHTHTHALS